MYWKIWCGGSLTVEQCWFSFSSFVCACDVWWFNLQLKNRANIISFFFSGVGWISKKNFLPDNICKDLIVCKKRHVVLECRCGIWQSGCYSVVWLSYCWLFVSKIVKQHFICDYFCQVWVNIHISMQSNWFPRLFLPVFLPVLFLQGGDV